MKYSFDITVETTHTSTNLKEEEMNVAVGYIREVRFIIPPGPRNKVNFQIWFRGLQLYPKRAQQWYHGNRLNIEFTDNFHIDSTPARLTFVGYGTSCRYDHTITCQFVILPYPDPVYYLEKILNSLGTITRWFLPKS